MAFEAYLQINEIGVCFMGNPNERLDEKILIEEIKRNTGPLIGPKRKYVA